MAIPTDPLTGVRLKIERGEKQLNVLNQEILGFVDDPNAYGIVGEFEGEGDPADYVARVAIYRQIDPSWAVIAAEILHNFRSALNQLAWQLALLTTPEPETRTEFPIFIDPDRFESLDRGGGMWKMVNLPEAARTCVKGLQPCYRTDGKTPESHPLWLLHELNREDKHRLLPLAAWSLRSANLRLLEDGKFSAGLIVLGLRPVEDGREVMRKSRPRSAEMSVEVNGLEFDVAFERPDVAHGRIVIDTLHRIGSFIVAEVLPELELLFAAR
jgi:hypothetical protein